ncbi:XrtA system polysaccharide chain length determinant [Stakelama saccharophila]|uniref:Chain-length determining protein n=1 Tax=Stakelama saccharophila TaxID=3075605 RepID=A0ABZ0B6P7_9SPHN|nr:XrtA system polysaccharide chain length determinant [Stakelama sp. W311]WNO52801.1 chain-length determining protein [Stakelama sp. W311]
MGGMYEELKAALHAIWTRRWIALAVAWAICLAGWLVVSQIPNAYQSSARVFVQLRTILPNAAAGAARIEQAKDIDRVRQTLTSAVNLEKVVRGTDLARTVSSDADVAARVAALQDMIEVTAQQDNLFRISATVAGGSDARSATLSKQIVQKMIDIFVEENLADDRAETSQSLDFLNQQLAQREKQLQEADAKRTEFRNRYLSGLPGTGSLSDRIDASQSELADVESDLAAARSSLHATQSQMAATGSRTAASGAAAGPAQARVATIEGQLADARARGWTDDHPDVIALKRQLAAAKAAAKDAPVYTGGGAANPLYVQLQSMQAQQASQVAQLQQRKARLETNLQQLQAKLDADPAAAATQAQIERDYVVLKNQYDQLLADREQVKLQSQVQNQTDAVKFSVIDPPTSPTAPASPNRPLLLTAVLVLGLAGGVGTAFGLAQIRTSFATTNKLERASGLPVIGSIGEVVTEARAQLLRRRMKWFLGGAAGLGAAYVLLLGVEFVQRGLVA